MPGFTAVGKRPVAGGTGRKRTGILVVRGGGVTLGALGVTSRSTAQPHATVGGHGASLATTLRYGRRLGALNLFATGDYLSVANSASLTLGATSFTFEWWMLPNSLNTSNWNLWEKSNSSAFNTGAFGVAARLRGSGIMEFARACGAATATTRLSCAGFAVAGQVAHCVLTFDLSTGKLSAYKNGALFGSITYTGAELATFADTYAFTVGRGGNNDWTNGPVDGVRIYTRALTAAEAASRYAGAEVDLTGLGGWWRLNGTPSDSSGNGNAGVVQGAATFVPGFDHDQPSVTATGGGASYDTVLTLRHGSGWATGEGSARVVVLATKATHLVATLGGLATSGGVPTYLGRPGTQHVPEDIRITTDRAGNAVALITQRPARPPVASELPASRAASSAPDRETSRRASGVPTSTLRSAE